MSGVEEWSPDPRADRESAVHQAVGSASVCWENPAGAGVFDSDRAKLVAEGLLAWLADHEPAGRLDFETLREQSLSRRDRWHSPGTVPWSGADWSNAMCGEAGEAANVVKKLRRHETGMPDVLTVAELLFKLADELGDVIAYAVLLAEHYGIDLGTATARKFNIVSEREGFPERLPRCGPLLRPSRMNGAD